MLRIMKSLPLILALAAFGISATGCGNDHAQVRFVHASPDAPNVDITVNSKSVATNLAFGSVAPASGYLSVNAGNRTVQVFATGTTTPALINSNINFSSQKHYTVLASGKLASIAAVVLTDDNSAPTSGNIKLRVVHASPSGPADLDVYVVAQGTDISGLAPNISSLAYQQASSYQSLAAATYEVIVTDSSDASKTRCIDQSYPLTAGQVRTLVVLDDLSGQCSLAAVPLELNDLN